jgi:hypothetical protein
MTGRPALSAQFVWFISHKYFCLRTNQPPAIKKQYFSLRTNQHQPSVISQTIWHHRIGCRFSISIKHGKYVQVSSPPSRHFSSSAAPRPRRSINVPDDSKPLSTRHIITLSCFANPKLLAPPGDRLVSAQKIAVISGSFATH